MLRLGAGCTVVCALLSAGCGGSDGGYVQPPQRTDAFIKDEARKAKEKLDFPVLWLGRSYRGWQFNELYIQRHVTGGAPAADAIYGDCEIPSDQDEGGCSVPYEVQQRNACDAFMVRLTRQQARQGPGGTLTYTEDGAPVIVTGRTRVKIYGRGAKVAVRQLRPAGREEPGPGLRPAARCARG